MQHRIPNRDLYIKCIDLTQNLRRKDKNQDNRLKSRRNTHSELLLNNLRYHKKNQCQDAQEHIMIIPQEKLAYNRQYHHRHQHDFYLCPLLPYFHYLSSNLLFLNLILFYRIHYN